MDGAFFVCLPVQVLQEVGLWAVWQTENFTQQRQQVNSLKPGVTVTWLRTERDKDRCLITTHTLRRHCHLALSHHIKTSEQTELTATMKFKTPAHLQGNVDLILDVFDDVAFDTWVVTGFQHVPETRRPVRGGMEQKETFLMTFKEKDGAYWKKLYLASVSNLSMLSWNTFRPLVLCWQRNKYVIYIYILCKISIYTNVKTYQIMPRTHCHDLHQVLKTNGGINNWAGDKVHISEASHCENDSGGKTEVCMNRCVHLRDGKEGFDLQQICRQAAILHPHQTLLIQLLCDGKHTFN